MTVQDDVRGYIVGELGWAGDPETLTGDLDLIEHQVIDSLSVVELVALLQQWYDISIGVVEVVYDNFHSLNAIAKLAEAKRRDVS